MQSDFRPSTLGTAALIRIGELTNRTLILPVAVFFPTSRCNSRCVSCDWWTHSGEDDLQLDEIEAIADELKTCGTRLVLFSGGEPLLRPDVFAVADVFLKRELTLHLLTSGVLLERVAPQVGKAFAHVIVSLDATTEQLYQRVRGVAALTVVERGVARLRRLAPHVGVTARSTLHRLNFRELPALINHAKAMALDGISFLAADVSTMAFGRERLERNDTLTLSRAEVAEFRDVIEQTIETHADDFESGFIAESPDRLRRLAHYYGALAGYAPFPSVDCNAPYVSVVIEADGAVRPCFFHQVIGSVRHETLSSIVRRNLPAFRDTLVIDRNPVCARCVCSIKTTWRHAPWH